MRVADVLKAKGSDVITIKPDATIEALSLLLRERRIGAVVVSKDGVSIDGVISERDLAYAIAKHGADLHRRRVSDLMITKVITCNPDDSVGHVASTMRARNVRHLPVERDRRVVGMVSIRDVLNVRVDELQRQTAEMRSFLSMASQPPQDRE